MRCFVGVISIEEKKSMEYKRQIMEMLSKIDNENWLIEIYSFVRVFYERRTDNNGEQRNSKCN